MLLPEREEDNIVCDACENFDCGIHEGGTGIETDIDLESENEDAVS
jgi:hypothetical protein